MVGFVLSGVKMLTHAHCHSIIKFTQAVDRKGRVRCGIVRESF